MDQSNKIDKLQREIEELKKIIKWYSDTYEKRSLAGILKDRAIAQLNKVNKSFKKAGLQTKSPRIIPKAQQVPTLRLSPLKRKKVRQVLDKKKILCTVVNHNHNENAKKLQGIFSRYFKTIVIDSGSKIKEAGFINLPNVYYSGLYNHAYNHALKSGYDYLLFICSDVTVEEEQLDIMANNLATYGLDNIGVYSPTSTGRSHYQCKKMNERGLRIVDFVEGFFFLANMAVLKPFSPIDVNKNLLGWGIDVAKGFYTRELNLLCVIDDGVTVHHPEEVGYSPDSAEDQMFNWFKTLPDGENLSDFHTNRVKLIRQGIEKSMKVSVIIPCYNQGQYLEETIMSVFNQKHSDFEIIIINDGSTDNTHQIATQLGARFNQIKYFSQQNSGLGASRNAGLDNATGNLIQFLDADDTLSNNKFSSAVEAFARKGDVDIVYSAYLCYEDGNRNNSWTYSRVEMEGDPITDLITEWEKELSIPVHCFLFRKEIIGQIRFDTTLPNHEDWAFHLHIASRKPKYHHTSQATAYYRIKQVAMSQDKGMMKKGKNMCLANVIGSKVFNGQYLPKLFSRFDYSLVIGIVTCRKNIATINHLRTTLCEDLKRMGLHYYFIIGDKNAAETYIEDDIIYVNCPDNYESLPKKVLLFYEYIYFNTNYDYIFKIDDDCYLNVENIYATQFWNYDYFGRIVATDSKDVVRTWHYGKCETPALNTTPYSREYIGPWCGGGYGYFLSRYALSLIHQKREQIYNELYEDKAIGDALREMNVIPSENPNYQILNVKQFDIDHYSDSEVEDLLHAVGTDINKYQIVIEIINHQYYYIIKENKKKYELTTSNMGGR